MGVLADVCPFRLYIGCLTKPTLTLLTRWALREPNSLSLSLVYMYAHERNLILMFLHICRNCATAMWGINCLIVLWYCRVYLCLWYSRDWLLDVSKWT